MQQLNDGGNIAMNMNIHHHHHHANTATDHYDNVLNLNLNNDYHHYGADYWNSSYKNGSTPMKEMEGELLRIFDGSSMFRSKLFDHYFHIFSFEEDFTASSLRKFPEILKIH